MDFICKEFALNHSISTMKVGTDAILLSSAIAKYFSSIDFDNIIDIGTGCGIVALCTAQIFPKASVTAIDIDTLSIHEAQENFQNSKYHRRLSAQNISLQQFAYNNENHLKYNLIVSNPPFFSHSLSSPDNRRTIARHNSVLTPEDFALCSDKLISTNGYIALILPPNEMATYQKFLTALGYNTVYNLNILPKPYGKTKRNLNIFSKTQNCLLSEYLNIRDEQGKYSKEYQSLTQKFLL